MYYNVMYCHDNINTDFILCKGKDMIKIACVGDNVVDIHYDKKCCYPGGNAVNVSVYARHMGAYSAYVGVLGNDSEGQLVLSSLKTEGVDVSKCVIRDGQTGRSGIHLINGDRVIVEENNGGVVSSQPLVLDEGLVDYLADFDVIHTSHLSYLDDQLSYLKRTGKPIIYDFSVYWTRDLIQKVAPYIAVAFFSAADRSEEDILGALRQCVDESGCELAIVTDGGNGARVYDGKQIHYKAPYNFDGGAVDTTGAGDSWLTGFVIRWVEGKKLLERFSGDGKRRFLRECDIADYNRSLIEQAMANANLLARYYCQFKGGFGYETDISAWEKPV